jgi:hypothetical protein
LGKSTKWVAKKDKISNYATCAVAWQPGNPVPVLAQVQQVWESVYPDHFYDLHFAGEQIALFLQTETTLLLTILRPA